MAERGLAGGSRQREVQIWGVSLFTLDIGLSLYTLEIGLSLYTLDIGLSLEVRIWGVGG